jgi:hypothetical protein
VFCIVISDEGPDGSLREYKAQSLPEALYYCDTKLVDAVEVIIDIALPLLRLL